MKINIICRIIHLSAVLTLAIVLTGCRKVCPILDIEGGQVQGISTGINGVYVFRGIPYAAPPIHGLRWKPPSR